MNHVSFIRCVGFFLTAGTKLDDSKLVETTPCTNIINQIKSTNRKTEFQVYTYKIINFQQSQIYLTSVYEYHEIKCQIGYMC